VYFVIQVPNEIVQLYYNAFILDFFFALLFLINTFVF